MNSNRCVSLFLGLFLISAFPQAEATRITGTNVFTSGQPTAKLVYTMYSDGLMDIVVFDYLQMRAIAKIGSTVVVDTPSAAVGSPVVRKALDIYVPYSEGCFNYCAIIDKSDFPTGSYSFYGFTNPTGSSPLLVPAMASRCAFYSYAGPGGGGDPGGDWPGF